MIKDEISIPNQTIECRCVESKIKTDRLHYGRFAISPFRKGQASTVGIATRKASLGEIEGTGTTYAKFGEIKHEYSTITGIQETIHDILVNLKETALRSNFRDNQKGFLYVTGPKKVTAGDTSLPSTVEAVDHSQYIATIVQPVSLRIDLRIERGCGYRIQDPKGHEDGEFPVDAVSMPVRSANYSVHPFENAKEMGEILFIEIWTNGSLTPHEVLYEASRKLINLFNPFIYMKHGIPCHENENNSLDAVNLYSHWNGTDELVKEITLKNIFIDQLELPPRIYNCLKRADINTIMDLLKYTREDLQKINNFGKISVDRISKALWEHLSIKLPNDKF
uniref:RNA polymerase alpha subunit n=1 Tax=Anemia phyllitidis TaxID=12940 RepID=UPI0021ACBA91|nr:RNA polymerase alpha subunit [Anemia phyllitidis]UUL71105.1 RNA polymerase alpha subunit [Anemia phyllitidis]